MDKKQQQALQKHVEHLSQLIIRLSGFYEGANAPIDKELAVLRSHLSGNPNFTLAQNSINKLSSLLMDGDKQLQQVIKKNVASLQDAVKSIQQTASDHHTFKTASARFLTNLSLPTSQLSGLLEHFFSAVSLLDIAINNNSKALTKTKHNNSYAKASEPSEQAVASKIVSELQQLVDVYASKKPDDPQISSLRQTLDDGLNEQQLLESCLVLIRLVISETMLDASANGKAVQSIFKAINRATNQVDESIAISTHQADRQSDHHIELSSMLGELDDGLDETDDIDGLRNKTREQIDRIRETLNNHKEATSKDQESLLVLLNDMQAKLNSLQQKTNAYKQRLVEQRTSLYTDPLTRIPNRLAYNERAQKLIDMARGANESLCLAVVDVDHFKTINDQYGHAAGDRTLQVIAKHLKKQLNPNEFIARWGGEEFVILAHNQTAKGFKERLETLRQSLSELPFKFKQTPVKITASFGACSLNGNDTMQSFFERADSGLYQAKAAGRNCVIVIDK